MKIYQPSAALSSLASALGYVGTGVIIAKLFTLISFFAAASILNSEHMGFRNVAS